MQSARDTKAHIVFRTAALKVVVTTDLSESFAKDMHGNRSRGEERPSEFEKVNPVSVIARSYQANREFLKTRSIIE